MFLDRMGQNRKIHNTKIYLDIYILIFFFGVKQLTFDGRDGLNIWK